MYPERWRARRAILVLQRNIQERKFILLTDAGYKNQKLADSWKRLNELIEGCNHAIDFLEDVAEVAKAHLEERVKVSKAEVLKVAHRKTTNKKGR